VIGAVVIDPPLLASDPQVIPQYGGSLTETDAAAAGLPNRAWVPADVDAEAMGAATAPAMIKPATPVSIFFMTTPL
jgi:hypothetical protein